MGVVFAGRDVDLGRRVAIKVLHSAIDRPAYRERLLREARAMALIDHPNVVHIYEVGSDHARLYVAMELVEGTTLSAWLHAEQRPWRAVVAMFAEAGAGLAAVHRAGIVHRDFKPENVLVDRMDHARVADFGLARFDDDHGLESLTRTGMRLGTPAYMAPEQIAGGMVDARADQYSFCVALREALLRWPAMGEPANWRDIPQAIRDVVRRGLAHAPADRFATMDDLLVALTGIGSRRRVPVRAVLAVAALAAAATGVTIAVQHRATEASPPPPAGTVIPAAPADAATTPDAPSASLHGHGR